jgi:L-methionine (R)-S-oxide reductase
MLCVREMFTYKVPTLNAAGTCSNLAQLAKRSFSLANDVYHLSEDVMASDDKLISHPLSHRLQWLNNTVNELRNLTGADWIGIYRMVRADGDLALVKEAYLGEPSRPVFPVTDAFAQKSTNSWVALSARGRSIPDTHHRDEGVTYYECSGRVRSELCVPILRRRRRGEAETEGGESANQQVWEVVGIIDLESWKLDHFHNQMICDVMQVAFDLGGHNDYAVLP